MNPDRIKPMIHEDTTLYWIDVEKKRSYRRISAGVAWPLGTLPGFVVILGEERYKETGFPDNLVYTLAEAESPTFDDLFRKALDLSRLFHCEDFRANTSDQAAMEILHRWGRRQREDRSPSIHFRPAAFTHLGDLKTCFAYGIQRIADRTATGGKTLNLEDCPSLQRCLATIPGEAATGDKAANYPPLAALCMVLASLDSNPYHEPEFKNSRRTYDPITHFSRR